MLAEQNNERAVARSYMSQGSIAAACSQALLSPPDSDTHHELDEHEEVQLLRIA